MPHTTQQMVEGLGEALMGSYYLFEIKDVTYHPSKQVQDQIRDSIYGISPSGHFFSPKYVDETSSKIAHVNFSRPLDHNSAEGDFYLFLPKKGTAFGMMDLRSLSSSRPDVNLSIVSPRALMPYRLNITGDNHNFNTFYAVDSDGSNWSIHSKRKT
jgi:hypothetical protein